MLDAFVPCSGTPCGCQDNSLEQFDCTCWVRHNEMTFSLERAINADHVEELCQSKAKSIVILERDNTVTALSQRSKEIATAWQMNMKCITKIIPTADQATLHPKKRLILT